MKDFFKGPKLSSCHIPKFVIPISLQTDSVNFEIEIWLPRCGDITFVL